MVNRKCDHTWPFGEQPGARDKLDRTPLEIRKKPEFEVHHSNPDADQH
jgi:hypothetical protein